MEKSNIIHLVSNAPEHPENTASQFKVSYNTPFDLTGKKIALIDASFTKAQNNVLGEQVTLSMFGPPIKYVVDLMHKPNDRWINKEEFCKRFNRFVRDENGKLLVETRYFIDEEEPHVANVVILNKSRHKIVVTFKYDDKYFFYEGDANLSPMYSEEGDYYVHTISTETIGCRISYQFMLDAIDH